MWLDRHEDLFKLAVADAVAYTKTGYGTEPAVPRKVGSSVAGSAIPTTGMNIPMPAGTKPPPAPPATPNK